MRPLLVLAIVAVLMGYSSTKMPTESPGPHVYSISELLADRAADKVSGGPITLAGFWSYLEVPSSCLAPLDGEPGELELYCSGGDDGITELDEPILAIVGELNEPVVAKGPHLTPFVPEGGWARLLFDRPHASGSQPVPIVVVGHMDDPRARSVPAEGAEALPRPVGPRPSGLVQRGGPAWIHSDADPMTVRPARAINPGPRGSSARRTVPGRVKSLSAVAS